MKSRGKIEDSYGKLTFLLLFELRANYISTTIYNSKTSNKNHKILQEFSSKFSKNLHQNFWKFDENSHSNENAVTSLVRTVQKT